MCTKGHAFVKASSYKTLVITFLKKKKNLTNFKMESQSYFHLPILHTHSLVKNHQAHGLT